MMRLQHPLAIRGWLSDLWYQTRAELAHFRVTEGPAGQFRWMGRAVVCVGDCGAAAFADAGAAKSSLPLLPGSTETLSGSYRVDVGAHSKRFEVLGRRNGEPESMRGWSRSTTVVGVGDRDADDHARSLKARRALVVSASCPRRLCNKTRLAPSVGFCGGVIPGDGRGDVAAWTATRADARDGC
uniref:Uncharacterized protein n=1 Tax=Mycena chlorophos TaxID=658473 RepID=A0ABQ0L6R1_MYCCL|nr:predicted protein [Mycena chlorophos]